MDIPVLDDEVARWMDESLYYYMHILKSFFFIVALLKQWAVWYRSWTLLGIVNVKLTKFVFLSVQLQEKATMYILH